MATYPLNPRFYRPQLQFHPPRYIFLPPTTGSQGPSTATAGLPGTRTPVHGRTKRESDNCDIPHDVWTKNEMTESITPAANKSSIGCADPAYGLLGGEDYGELLALPFDTAPVTSFECPTSPFPTGSTSDLCVPVEHIRSGVGFPVDRAQRPAGSNYADAVSVRAEENGHRDFERLLLAGGGPWGSAHAINACSPSAQPLGCWPWHSHEGQGGTLSNSNIVRPASVWDDVMFSTEGLLADAESNIAAGMTNPGDDGQKKREGAFDTSIPADQICVTLLQQVINLCVGGPLSFLWFRSC